MRWTSFCVVDDVLSTGQIGGCGDVVEEELSGLGAGLEWLDLDLEVQVKL